MIRIRTGIIPTLRISFGDSNFLLYTVQKWSELHGKYNLNFYVTS